LSLKDPFCDAGGKKAWGEGSNGDRWGGISKVGNPRLPRLVTCPPNVIRGWVEGGKPGRWGGFQRSSKMHKFKRSRIGPTPPTLRVQRLATRKGAQPKGKGENSLERTKIRKGGARGVINDKREAASQPD